MANTILNNFFSIITKDTDITTMNENEIETLVKSKIICGVLQIKRKMPRDGKMFYKCIPNDNALPEFFVPYKEHLKFQKQPINKYVTFRYHSITNNIFLGRLEQTLGDVNNIESFYEYRLFCKDLFSSNKKFNTATINAMKNTSLQLCDEDRRSHHIITIDSSDTTDYDDAISYNNNCLSIYIANVPQFMEQYDLWNHMSNKVSTIYLPGMKRAMLPNILTDDILSLKEGVDRNVFYMDINMDTFQVQFGNATICVRKNHVYESNELLNLPLYDDIFMRLQSLLTHYSLIKEINNSYHVIEYLMILMNNRCAMKLKEHGVGIFRALQFNDNMINDMCVEPEIQDFIMAWKNAKSSYTIEPEHRHEMLQLNDYVHITSPIRRLVDILNMLQMQIVCNISTYGNNALTFYDSWIKRIDYINDNCKKIKKVQNESNIIHWCFVKQIDEIEITCDAHVIEINDNIYTVYIKEQNYIGKLSTDVTLQLYEKISIRMFLFGDNASLNRKIRLTLNI